jgi:DNA-binding MarR family transcriptional regulator
MTNKPAAIAAPDPDDLDRMTLEFRRAMRKMLREMVSVSRNHVESFGIPSVEIHILLHLLEAEHAGRRDVLAKELAVALDLDKGGVSRALRDLERKSYISRKAQKIDARRQSILLRNPGRKLAEMLEKKAQEWARESLLMIDEEGRARLMNGLAVLEDIYFARARREAEANKKKRRPSAE